LSLIDYLLIITYLVFSFGIALWQKKEAQKGLEQYFLAGRSLPWWWVGTSMVATTFAADTPLAITGLVYSGGIVANWLWFSWAVTYVLIFTFFARNWRRSKVLTDIEFTRIRYGDEQAKILRPIKAVFLGVVINLVILGWVFKAMGKISSVFFKWKHLLGDDMYSFFLAIWPSFLLLGSIDNTLTIFTLLLLVILYTSLGGLRSVMFTDLFQFLLAMVGSIYLAWISVQAVGGLGELTNKLQFVKAADGTPVLQLFFSFGKDDIFKSLSTIFLFFLIQPLTQYYSDGTGYLAQRLNAAKSEQDAVYAGWWFVIANFALRTWPWLLTALASLVYLQVVNKVPEDPELAYPKMMQELLAPGMLGLVLVGLLAAFMSTVDTHLNWGASYLVNDFFKKPVNEEQAVKRSRLVVIFLGVSSVFVAAQMDSIAGAWKFLIALGAGLGIAQLMRWFWWRVNALSEILSMLASFFATLVVALFWPETSDEIRILLAALSALVACIIGAVWGKQVEKEVLDQFIELVKPVGFWQDGKAENHLLVHYLLALVLALVQVYAFLLTPGFFLQGKEGLSLTSLLVAVLLFWPLKYSLKKI
jgi:solute:Na+ symporter, SSS family